LARKNGVLETIVRRIGITHLTKMETKIRYTAELNALIEDEVKVAVPLRIEMALCKVSQEKLDRDGLNMWKNYTVLKTSRPH